MNMHSLKGIFLPFFALLGFTLVSAQDDVYYEPSSNYFKHYNKIQHQQSLHEDDYGVTYYDDNGYSYGLMTGTDIMMIMDIVIRDLISQSISVGVPGLHSAGGAGITGTIIIPTTIGMQRHTIMAIVDGVADIIIIGTLILIIITILLVVVITTTIIMVTPIMEAMPVDVVTMIGDIMMIGDTMTITPGTYYGPRVGGNTGSSPRGPIMPPGVSQPVYAGKDLADQNDNPAIADIPNARCSQSRDTPAGVDQTPASIPSSRNDAVAGVGKDIPVDKELPRDNHTRWIKASCFQTS
jgi:hypothetical protein